MPLAETPKSAIAYRPTEIINVPTIHDVGSVPPLQTLPAKRIGRQIRSVVPTPRKIQNHDPLRSRCLILDIRAPIPALRKVSGPSPHPRQPGIRLPQAKQKEAHSPDTQKLPGCGKEQLATALRLNARQTPRQMSREASQERPLHLLHAVRRAARLEPIQQHQRLTKHPQQRRILHLLPPFIQRIRHSGLNPVLVELLPTFGTARTAHHHISQHEKQIRPHLNLLEKTQMVALDELPPKNLAPYRVLNPRQAGIICRVMSPLLRQNRLCSLKRFLGAMRCPETKELKLPFPQAATQHLQRLHSQKITRINKQNVAPARHIKPAIPGGRNTPILLEQHPEAVIPRGILAQHVGACILRTIIDTNSLPIGKALCPDGFQTLPQIGGCIVHRDNHRKQRTFTYRLAKKISAHHPIFVFNDSPFLKICSSPRDTARSKPPPNAPTAQCTTTHSPRQVRIP